MKLLVTGASGFIGSRVLAAICDEYGPENVIAFSSRPIDKCQTVSYQVPAFTVKKEDHDLLATVDVLIHVGAYIPKSGKDANAIEACDSNIFFTEKLLNLPLKCLKKILYISTVDVYEPADLTNEDTPTIPVSLYGWSKLYCERMLGFFAIDQNIEYQILRIGHVYGPGEEVYAKFLPKTINNLLVGESIELWGDGSEKRSFIYVNDVVSSILRAISFNENVGPINVVGGLAVSMRALIDKLALVSGKIPIIRIKNSSLTKRDYVFDNAKLRKYLLKEETSLISGLKSEYEYMSRLK